MSRSWTLALPLLLVLLGPAFGDDEPWQAPTLDRAALVAAREQARAKAAQIEGENAEDWKQATTARVSALTALIDFYDARTAVQDASGNERRRARATAANERLANEPVQDVRIDAANQDDLLPFKERNTAAGKRASEAAGRLQAAQTLRQAISRRTAEGLQSELEQAKAAAADAGQADELAKYRAATARLRIRLLESERALREVPPDAWQGWLGALLAERDETRTQATRAQALLERASQQVATALKQAEADAKEAAAEQARQAEEEKDPIARFRKRIAAQVGALQVLDSKSEQTSVVVDRRLAEAKVGLRRLADERTRLEQRLQLSGGTSEKIAGLLRRTLARLQRNRALIRDERRPWLYAEVERVQTARAETQDRIWELEVPVEESVLFEQLSEELGPDRERRTEEARAAYREAVAGPDGLLPTLLSRRSTLEDIDGRLAALEAGEEGYGAWLGRINELYALVMRRIYWVRTDVPISADTLSAAAAESGQMASFFADGSHWTGVKESARERPLPFWGLLLTLGALAMLLVRHREGPPAFLARRLKTGGPLWRTLKQTGAELFRAATWPGCLLLLAVWLRTADSGQGALTPISHALQLFAIAWFGWRFVRGFLGPEGVAVRRFGMSEEMAAQLRKSATFGFAALILFYLPRQTVLAAPFQFAALPRLLHPLFLATSFVGIWLLLPRRQPVASKIIGKKGFLYGVWGLATPLLGVLFAGIVAMDVFGYRIGADALATNVLQTLILAIVLSALYFVLRRVTQAAANRVLHQQSLESGKKEARKTSQTVLNQLTRLTSVGVLVALVLALAHFWNLDETLRGALQPIHLAEVEAGVHLTLWDVFRAVLIVVLAHFVVRNLRGLLEFVVFPLIGATDTGTRYVLATFARYGILVVAWSAAFLILHFSFSSIGWLLAAASVGIGFGLQEIVANFVSGIILLLERPVRVGDVVSVGDTWGTIEQIQARATHVLNRDRQMVVIPNKNFITTEVINWTRNDRAVRRIVPVGVSYGSDVQQVLAILKEVVAANRGVLAKPAPRILFVGFGDSSLDFQIRFFADAEGGVQVRSQLHEAVFERFSEEGIEIPFPQRDLHIRSGGAEALGE